MVGRRGESKADLRLERGGKVDVTYSMALRRVRENMTNEWKVCRGDHKETGGSLTNIV